jgi:hypothetical protein
MKIQALLNFYFEMRSKLPVNLRDRPGKLGREDVIKM